MAVENDDMGVPMEFGDSSSNSFRDIRGADFVSNERTNERTKATAFRLKTAKDRPCVSVGSYRMGLSLTPSSKRQISERRSSTICTVVERPDHHCGDDLS